MNERDTVVIGGGPAGYVAALRASQLGVKVSLIEENKLGGVCLNSGCIPTKFLLHAVNLQRSIGTAGEYGIEVTGAAIGLTRLQEGKNRLVSSLVSGVRQLLAAGKIEVINGRAKLGSSSQVDITTGDGEKQSVRAAKIIIATGGKAVGLPVPGADNPEVINYEGLLSLDRVPESMVIIGGGVIGVEMATVYNRLGCRVSIVEMMPRILPTVDAEIVSVVDSALRKDGVNIYCGAGVEKIEDAAEGKQVSFSIGGEVNKLGAKIVAVTTGQKPNIESVGLDECGVAANEKGIKVNERMETSVTGIYAAGDITGGMMLAHVAFAEGKTAAENATGGEAIMDYQAVPQCIFTSPEIAGVGLSEEEAVAQGYEVEIGRFPFSASGMAAILGETGGMVKIITEKKYSRILGVHIAGPSASNLIAEAALAIKMELTPQEIIETIHSHPSLSEAFWEAALDISGESIHFPSRKKTKP